MNAQTIFYLKLDAKKKACEIMIESCKSDAKNYPHKADFFVSEIVRFETKLTTINEIIKDYLND